MSTPTLHVNRQLTLTLANEELVNDAIDLVSVLDIHINGVPSRPTERDSEVSVHIN
jgi:hypothetical protein